MKTIYAVCPFCKSNRLPDKQTVERVVFDNAYFFAGYSDNILYVKRYMDFMDGLFGNVFHNLRYGIMQYNYLDKIKYASGDMIDFIELTYNVRMFREQVINRIVTEIPYNKTKVELYLNDMMYYGQQLDYGYLGEEMVDQDGFDVVRETFFYVNYNEATEPIFTFLERIETIIDTVHVDNRICNDLYAVYELYIQVVRRIPIERRLTFGANHILGGCD